MTSIRLFPLLLLAISPLARASDATDIVVNVEERRNLVPPKEASSKTAVDRERIESLAGGSTASLPHLISTTTPGVVQGAFGQLFIRGNHASIQYQIDGVQMPESASGTFGDAFSPRNIERMEVITGGIPAEYGERLGAVVNIVTKAGPEAPQGQAEVKYGSYNLLQPQLNYGGTNASGRLRYFIAGSWMQTERGLDVPNPASVNEQSRGGVDSQHNRATGADAFLRLDYQLSDVDKLAFNAFFSSRFYQIPNYPASFRSSDPYFGPGYRDQFGNQAEDAAQPTYRWVPSYTDDSQNEQNVYLQGVWKRTLSDRAFLLVAPYYKRSQIGVGADPTNDLASKVAGGPNFIATESQATSFSLDRSVDNYGLKTDVSWRPADAHLMKAGFQAQQSNARGAFTLQTDPAQAASRFGSSDAGAFEAVYAQDAWTMAREWTLTAGLRYTATQFNSENLSAHDEMLQPRAGLEWAATESTRLHAFYGKLFQPAPFENLRAAFTKSGGGNAAAPYDVKAEKDDYFEMGVAQQLGDTHVANLVLYYKDAVDMLDDAQLLNTSIAQPYNFAQGYAKGAELSLSGEFGSHWRHFWNYSYEEAKGRGLSGGIFAFDPSADGSGGEWQFLDHVQLHTANAGVTYFTDSYWATAQGQYGSGLRTGADNAASLPSHLTMDLSVGYSFRGETWLERWRIAGDVTNVFDNPYPITINNGFNGSHYAAGRQFFVRLAKDL